MRQQQKGFTLVEIAIVLVIIGLLLGGILKGQELINSARVRNLADSTTGIQAAYFGFIDRYRRVPGDWDKTTAGQAIGGTITSGGNNNGRLDGTPTVYREPNALWEHLSKAGFINGSYTGGDSEPSTANGAARGCATGSPLELDIRCGSLYRWRAAGNAAGAAFSEYDIGVYFCGNSQRIGRRITDIRIAIEGCGGRHGCGAVNG